MEAWNAPFRICAECGCLAVRRTTNKCKYCTANNQLNLYAYQQGSNYNPRGTSVRNVCAICNEPVRGYKVDEIEDPDSLERVPVCPYCHATVERLKLLPPAVLEATLTFASMTAEERNKRIQEQKKQEFLEEQHRRNEKERNARWNHIRTIIDPYVQFKEWCTELRLAKTHLYPAFIRTLILEEIETLENNAELKFEIPADVDETETIQTTGS